MPEHLTRRQLADALDPRDRATLRSLASALRSVRAANLCSNRSAGPNAGSLTQEAFLSAATATLSLELAEALLAAIVDTGEDFDTCLDMVADVPQAYVVVVHTYANTRVLTVALDTATAATWMEEHPDEAREASILPVRLLDPPDAAGWLDHSAAKEDARNEALETGASPTGVTPSWETLTHAALHRYYKRPDVAADVTQSDAFGALAHHMSLYCGAHGVTPYAVLQLLNPSDLAYAPNADNPAAFLAAKVRDL